MKTKIILTSILVITFALPAMAMRVICPTGNCDNDLNTISENPVTPQSGVGGSEQCDTSTLGQSENNSTANVEAIWIANKYNVAYKCAGNIFLNPTGYCKNENIGCAPTYNELYTFVPGDACASRTAEGYSFSHWSCTASQDNLVDESLNVPTYTYTYNARQSITWNIDSDLVCTAQYIPNIININWKSDGVNVAQNTCTYDQTITLPTEPTKTGYTFNGWVIHDDCGDLATTQICNANASCFWNSDENKCYSIALFNRDSQCAEISGRKTCNMTSGCAWSMISEKCKYDKMTDVCHAMTTSTECALHPDCVWNSNEERCLTQVEAMKDEMQQMQQ